MDWNTNFTRQWMYIMIWYSNWVFSEMNSFGWIILWDKEIFFCIYCNRYIIRSVQKCIMIIWYWNISISIRIQIVLQRTLMRY